MSITSLLALANKNNEVLRVDPGATRTVDLMITALGSYQSNQVTVYQLNSSDRKQTTIIVDAQGGGYKTVPKLEITKAAGRSMIELRPYMAASAIEIVSSGIYYAAGQTVTAAGVSMQVSGVDGNGRVQALTITNAPAVTTIDPVLHKPTGGTGRDLAVRLTYKLANIDVKTPGFVASGDISVVGDGAGARAHMVVDYAIQPQHELMTTTLGVNEFTLIKDLPLGGDDVLLVKPSQDVAVRIIEKN